MAASSRIDRGDPNLSNLSHFGSFYQVDIGVDSTIKLMQSRSSEANVAPRGGVAASILKMS